MLLLATIFTTTTLDLQSISYIDNQAYGIESEISGPIGYQLSIDLEALNIIPSAMFTLSILLADGPLVSSLFDVVFTHPGV